VLEQLSVVRFFLWAKGLNAKDIHKEIFLVSGGKCLSRKAVHNWGEKRGKPFADDEEVATEIRKWLRLVKRWDKRINVGGGYVEK
jgi:hypothetical protein